MIITPCAAIYNQNIFHFNLQLGKHCVQLLPVRVQIHSKELMKQSLSISRFAILKTRQLICVGKMSSFKVMRLDLPWNKTHSKSRHLHSLVIDERKFSKLFHDALAAEFNNYTLLCKIKQFKCEIQIDIFQKHVQNFHFSSYPAIQNG